MQNKNESQFLIVYRAISFFFFSVFIPRKYASTVEPRFTDTRLIRTPRYYGHFSLSLGKAHTFFQNSTRLIRTPVNTDNGHFFLPHQLILIGS